MTSARTAHRLTRILSMVPWVIANPGATAAEVCDRFGYTRGELIQDLNLIFVCGLPGYGPGDLMEAYLDEDEVVIDLADYFARPLRLTPAEGLTLLAAGMAVVSSGAGSPALRRAVDKLKAVLLADVVEVDIAPPADPAALGLLRGAVAAGEVVEITYTALGSGATTTRRVEPWSVFSTLGNWYLSGWCRRAEGERVFRIDRIRDAALIGERFDPPAEPPPPEVRYMPGEDDVRAVIRLGPGARWVAEYYPLETVADDGETMTVVFSAGDPAVAARLLVRLGAEAELVEDGEVAHARDELRRRILARYGATG